MLSRMIKRNMYFLFFTLAGFTSFAEDMSFLKFSGDIKFVNAAKKKNDVLPDTKIVITKNESTEVVKELMSDKKGHLELELDYGTDYKMTFTHDGYLSAYIIIYASQVPKENYDLLPPEYNTEIILMGSTEKGTDKYKCAFSKVIYDKKRKGFIEDMDHRGQFANSTIACAERFAKAAVAVKQATVAPVVVEDKKINIGGKFMAGENPSIPLVNTIVYLVNNENKVVETTTTNLLGAFVFTGFAYEKDNLLRVTASDTKISAGKRIVFIGRDGKEVQNTTANAKGGFEFKILTASKEVLKLIEVDDTQLKRDLIGKLLGEGSPIANSKLNLKSNDGALLQSAVTDANGKFIFSDVANNQVVVIAIDPSANIKAGTKVIIADENGKALKELIYKPNEVFEYKMLPAEQKELSRFYVDDPWLKVVNFNSGRMREDVVISESIYFKPSEAVVLPGDYAVLDKVVSILMQVPTIKLEVSSHTDSKGSNESNLTLSKKRADAVAAYLTAKKIDAKRLVPVGYGETKLLNKCKDGIECTEEEHAKNRRVEFKVMK